MSARKPSIETKDSRRRLRQSSGGESNRRKKIFLVLSLTLYTLKHISIHGMAVLHDYIISCFYFIFQIEKNVLNLKFYLKPLPLSLTLFLLSILCTLFKS